MIVVEPQKHPQSIQQTTLKHSLTYPYRQSYSLLRLMVRLNSTYDKILNFPIV